MVNITWDDLAFPFSYAARNPLYWLILPTSIAFMGAVAGANPLPSSFIAALLTLTYPAAFIVCAPNALYDRETDAYNDRDYLRGKQLTEDDAPAIWLWTTIFTVVCLLPPLIAWNVEALIIGTAMITAALAYSVPPLRLKAHPEASLLLMSMGAWLLYAYGHAYTDTITNIPVRSFYYGLITHTAVSLGALPDIEADKQADDTTFPVKYGETPTILLGIITCVAALASGTIHGVIAAFIAAYAASMVSMLIFKHYVIHFKAVATVGFLTICYYVWRGLSQTII